MPIKNPPVVRLEDFLLAKFMKRLHSVIKEVI